MKCKLGLLGVLLWGASGLWAQGQTVGGGVINTVAGNSQSGYNGDNRPGVQAQLNFIIGDADEEEFGHLAVDAAGNLYIADKGNHRIRKLDTNGIITTVAGTGTAGFNQDNIKATSAQLNFPTGLAVDGAGNIYFTDQRNDRVRKIDTDGIITTVAGSGAEGFDGDGEPATSSKVKMDWPSAVAVDAAGNLYIADEYNHRVRMVSAQSGRISTIAGNGQYSYGDAGKDGVAATSIKLGLPSALLLDGDGKNLFISDQHNDVIRVMNLQSGLIRRVAGTGQHSDDNPVGDAGPATEAPLGYPMGMALDKDGNLFFADMHNNVVRKVSSPLSAGALIYTPVGYGFYGFGGDGAASWNAMLAYPAGVAIDAAGNLFIADWQNQRVRKVVPGSSTPRPLVPPGGLVNGASFAPAPARVAPGSIVSIFGRKLAPSRAAATQVPLPATLANPSVSVKVTSGGSSFQMPLFYVSPDQINAQLPVELTPGSEATVVVKVGDMESPPVTINISPSETGIFTYGANRAVATNQDSRLNTFAEPAARGSVITVYVTGQGALSNPIPTGQPAPSAPLSQTTFDATATIGGTPASVEFLGATPGFVGLSQANITVPGNAPTGEQKLQITVGGHASNETVINIK